MDLIKLGGGLIAPKQLPEETADLETIVVLSNELKQIWDHGGRFVLVNGSGNFGHSWAKKYETQRGFDLADEAKKWGAARTQYSAGHINKIVVGALLDVGLPAISVSAHDLDDYKKVIYFSDMGLVPVLYGDVIWDHMKGCEIFSGETIIQKILDVGLQVEKIIQVSVEKGVWDEQKRIISEISMGNWEQVKQSITGSVGVDVTGGMLHKVEVSLEIAKKYRIVTYITNTLLSPELGTKIGV